MTRNRMLAKWLFVVGALPALIAHAEPCPIPRHSVASADEAVALAKRAISAYKLTATPVRCLTVEPAPGYAGPGFEIDVREHHVEGCGEALPMFDPLVLSIHVTPAGVLTTTAGAADAQPAYLRPNCPRAPRPPSRARG
jgi:hypothetical protein